MKMRLPQISKRHCRTFLTSGLLAFSLFYFSYHAISGNNGILTMLKLTRQVETAEAKLDAIDIERLQLKHRVQLMSGTIDLDMLDEQSRRFLSYARKKEYLYLIPQAEKVE